MGQLSFCRVYLSMGFQLAAAALLSFSLAAALLRDVPEECKYFTVGRCDPAQNEEIDVYDLPNGGGAIFMCQNICQLQEGCSYFLYNSKQEKCYLYHYRFLESCLIIGGTPSPSLDVCSHIQEDSCDSFVRQDCAYDGDLVFNKTSVTNAHFCQALLETVGFVYGAKYFVYDSFQHECFFYSSVDASCDSLSGPALPDFYQCLNP